jgi:hypothetical protein
MAYIFGDSFDCYATMADPIAGYWDSGFGVVGGNTLVAGRFAGSQAVSLQASLVSLVKASAVNDAVHHIVMAFRQPAALSGTTLGMYLQLSDAATNQCCIVFRSDGVILLTSATPVGTVLATYSGAVTAANTWFAFEFEVVINNTTGRFRARKNGNPADDFDSGATLPTRPGTNTYANKLTLGMSNGANSQLIDDLLWRSDASSVPFVGDVRCYTRMPASDASVQFSRVAPPFFGNVRSTSGVMTAGQALFVAFTPSLDITVSQIAISLNAAYTGNLKCAVYNAVGNTPTTVLQGATAPINNPVTGLNNNFTFSPPLSLAKGVQYYIAADSDTAGASNWDGSTQANGSGFASMSYASFPQSNPSISSSGGIVYRVTAAVANYALVNETIQDGTTTYVYDSTVGHADLYNIAPIAATPASTVAVITRAFAEKLDAGFRQVTVQVKSGATTVQATPQALANNFGWVYRADTVDPATGAAWTPAAVNSLQVGPLITG